MGKYTKEFIDALKFEDIANYKRLLHGSSHVQLKFLVTCGSTLHPSTSIHSYVRLSVWRRASTAAKAPIETVDLKKYFLSSSNASFKLDNSAQWEFVHVQGIPNKSFFLCISKTQRKFLSVSIPGDWFTESWLWSRQELLRSVLVLDTMRFQNKDDHGSLRFPHIFFLFC